MRFIGGKDYYDGVTGFDTDERRVFVRTNFNKAIPLEKGTGYAAGSSGIRWDSYIVGDNGLRQKDADLQELRIIFCGKLYKGVVRKESSYDNDTGIFSHTFKTFWNPETINAELERQKAKIAEPRKELWFSKYRGNIVNTANLPDYFVPSDVGESDLKRLIDNNIVHSIGFKNFGDRYGEVRWYDNTDGLKLFGFAGVIDPWQAYQQIDMWLGSQLAKEEDNMVKLSDKEIIAKHGFDEVSFRNTHHAGKPRGKV